MIHIHTWMNLYSYVLQLRSHTSDKCHCKNSFICIIQVSSVCVCVYVCTDCGVTNDADSVQPYIHCKWFEHPLRLQLATRVKVSCSQVGSTLVILVLYPMYDLAQLFQNQLFQDVATKLAIIRVFNSFIESLSQVASYALIISYISYLCTKVSLRCFHLSKLVKYTFLNNYIYNNRISY